MTPLCSLQSLAEDSAATVHQTIDRIYLEKGINALARAHHMSSMAGHLGASLIAGFYIGVQRQNLPSEVIQGIEGDLQRVIHGESVFGKRMSKNSKLTDQELFEPFSHQTPDESLIDGIAESLAQSIDQPRQSGHNVIFGSLAIRALKDHPEYATPTVVDGIRRLMNRFVGQTPGSGYYGKKRGRIQGNKITPNTSDETPDYNTIADMANAVLDEAINQDPSVHRIGYGGLVHIINHAAAIVDLADYGYDDLAQKAVLSHRKHLQLWRGLPNVASEKGQVPVSNHTPHSREYWTSESVPYDRALLTHRVKTMFGFDELAAAVEASSKEKKAYESLRYLM